MGPGGSNGGLRVSYGSAGRDGGAGRGLWLWSPCPACGGTVVPLRRPEFGHHACPGCETRRRRLGPVGPDPTVWFDTLLSDWVVQVPWPDACAGTLLPLEIGWFDADWRTCTAPRRISSTAMSCSLRLTDPPWATDPAAVD